MTEANQLADAFDAGFDAGIETALEILDNYSDVIDGPDGPMPNPAMRYMQEIKAALSKEAK